MGDDTHHWKVASNRFMMDFPDWMAEKF